MNRQQYARPSRLGRLTDYIHEMFPLQVRIPINLLNFAVIYFGLQALQGMPLTFTAMSLVGAVTVQILWLFIRVYDELKDAESDVALARQGDPRFTNRPLVTGKVKLADIEAFRWWLTIFVIAINAAFLNIVLLAGLLIGFGYLTLAYKWFFWPRMRENIIVVFITHIPNALAIQIYTTSVFVAEFGRPNTSQAVLLLLGLWMTVAGFEFSYKIRIPADETSLKTYSSVLGWRTATWGVIFFVGISAAAYVAFCMAAGLHPAAAWLVVAGAAWVLFGCWMFLFSPTRARAKLTDQVGLYWYLAGLGVLAGSLLKSGLPIGS